MQIGDYILYKNKKAQIIEIKWGLYYIKFFDTNKQIWVTLEHIKRDNF